ncbi:MAG: clostripain-related cysteine peptidase [Elusimicrobia bacterium]|nr:clostripain-related cysteine peptidase [Elusimicrobiota bacterium]
MKSKIAVVAVLTFTAGAFFYARPRNHIPSDLRDAVADSGAMSELKTAGQDMYGQEQVPAPAEAAPAAAEETAQKGLPSAPAAVREWTVMVFMSARNNLGDSRMLGLAGKFDKKDLAEMARVGSTDKVNVVVEHASNGKPARRLLITKGGSVPYGEFPGADMGDYNRLADFAVWTKRAFPAKRYMLVVWGHGLGWLDPARRRPEGGGNKGVAFDDETGNYIRTRQLGEALRRIGHVDVLMQHACLMQTAEVLYELKDDVGLFVGSEEEMLALGYEYDKLLAFLNADPGATYGRLSAFLMAKQREYFVAGLPVGPVRVSLEAKGATLSAVRGEALKELPAYLDAFADAAMRNREEAAVKKAVSAVIRFASLYADDEDKLMSPGMDLYDFARIVGANAENPETKRAAAGLAAFIKNRLVVDSVGINRDRRNDYTYAKVGGIAINMTLKAKSFPASFAGAFDGEYRDLALSKDSRWDEFVEWTDRVWRR